MTTIDFVRDDQGGGTAQRGDGSTGATEVRPAPELPATTTSYRELSDQAGFLRNVVRIIAGDVASLHRNLGHKGLDERAQEFKGLTTRELLNGLNRLGFTWRDVARMMRVSVPAVQKWRKGESASGENHKRLMVLRALMTMLDDFVSPVPPDCPCPIGSVSWWCVELCPHRPTAPRSALCLRRIGGDNDGHETVGRALHSVITAIAISPIRLELVKHSLWRGLCGC